MAVHKHYQSSSSSIAVRIVLITLAQKRVERKHNISTFHDSLSAVLTIITTAAGLIWGTNFHPKLLPIWLVEKDFLIKNEYTLFWVYSAGGVLQTQLFQFGQEDAKVAKLIEMCEAVWSIKSFWNMSGKLKNRQTCGDAEIGNAFWNYNCLVGRFVKWPGN